MFMMTINCFCVMVDRQKTLSFIPKREYCQEFSPSQIIDTPGAGFKPAQNLSSGFVQWSCAGVIFCLPYDRMALRTLGEKFLRIWT